MSNGNQKGCQQTVRREHRKVKGKEGNISKKQGSTRFDKTVRNKNLLDLIKQEATDKTSYWCGKNRIFYVLKHG